MNLLRAVKAGQDFTLLPAIKYLSGKPAVVLNTKTPVVLLCYISNFAGKW